MQKSQVKFNGDIISIGFKDWNEGFLSCCTGIYFVNLEENT